METGSTSVSNTQNKALKKRKPSENFVKNQKSIRESLISCSFSLIYNMLLLTQENEKKGEHNLSVYMDEMLHSIFFLGYIYPRKKRESLLTPSEFFKNPEIRELVMKKFPEPFEKYSSHLPTRTPFSILLDMMEKLYKTEENIKTELLRLLKELKFPNPLHKPGSKYEEYYTLEATVICMCYTDKDSEKYYGASLSCRKGNAKGILVDLSCLKTWHKFVSNAVMSFNRTQSGDGITFPESVKCQAYKRNREKNVYEIKHPCVKCKELFKLQDPDSDSDPDLEVNRELKYPYGNCAETECLSKLLFSDQYVREDTQMEIHTEENVKRLRKLTRANLMDQLQEVHFQMNNGNFQFYSPCK